MWSSIDGLCFVEGVHVTHVSIPLCPLGKSCPPVILHGPKLSLECTAGSLVCSLGSLIIRCCNSSVYFNVKNRKRVTAALKVQRRFVLPPFLLKNIGRKKKKKTRRESGINERECVEIFASDEGTKNDYVSLLVC